MTNNARRAASQAALIVLLTVVVYAPALRSGFVFDDKLLIQENPLIKASDGLYRFWFTTQAPDYYPLTWSAWWLQWRSWGRNPAGYHALNVLLHAANAILLWQILRRLKIHGAWLAGLVFALHPVNVATVAWISEQKNTLSMLFFAVAVILYLDFDENGRRRSYWLSLLGFLLALFSKTAVVMLPVVLLGCVWWRRKSLCRKDWLRSLPFFALSVIFGLLTIWFQSERALEGAVVRPEGFVGRLASAGWVPWFYLYKAVLPVDLMVIYPKWEIDPASILSYVPGVVLLSCFAVLWWKRESWGRPLLFAFGCFVAMLFPVMGFFDQGFYVYALVADHWQYHAIIGVIAVLVAACEQRFRRDWERGIGAAIVLLLAVATWNRAGVYKDDETLWRDNVARNPTAWTYNNLANSLREAGKVQEAIPHFEHALRLNPALAVVHYNYGIALKNAGRNRAEIAQYHEALRIKPDYAEAHYNLGVALWESGHPEEAIEHWQRALQIKPSMADAHRNLAVALGRLGRSDEELWHYREAVRIQPDYLAAQKNLADALMQRNRMQEAIQHYEQAVRIKPDYAEAHNDLAGALWRTGRVREAIRHFELAVRFKPGYPEAHYNLGGALEQTGDFRAAIAHYEQALRIRPDFAPARERLKHLQARQGVK